MANPWTLKLRHGAHLNQDDIALLDRIASKVEEIGARQDIISEGDQPGDVHLIVEGYACRYKTLEDGTRQIMAWLVPGDICDLHVAILGEMDHSIATLSPCKVAYVPVETVRELTARPNLNLALWWNTLTDEATLREWLVNMGRRSAEKQIAHLFCELFARMAMVDRVSDNTIDFPITQTELADTVGLSTVHVNRVLQSLRDEDLINLAGKSLHLPDPERLQSFAGFNPNYLHRANGKLAASRADRRPA